MLGSWHLKWVARWRGNKQYFIIDLNFNIKLIDINNAEAGQFS